MYKPFSYLAFVSSRSSIEPSRCNLCWSWSTAVSCSWRQSPPNCSLYCNGLHGIIRLIWGFHHASHKDYSLLECSDSSRIGLPYLHRPSCDICFIPWTSPVCYLIQVRPLLSITTFYFDCFELCLLVMDLECPSCSCSLAHHHDWCYSNYFPYLCLFC